MLKSKKTLTTIFFIILTFGCLAILSGEAVSSERNPQNTATKRPVVTNDHVIAEQISTNGKLKPLEEITVLDIVQDEDASPELRGRITKLVDQSQYEMDRYRTTISNHYKQVEARLVGFTKELDKFHSFRDDMEAHLGLSKLMIISLSVGIVCLTAIVIVMWKSVVNVNRNDVEVIFSAEKVRKELKIINKRLDMLETVYKQNAK